MTLSTIAEFGFLITAGIALYIYYSKQRNQRRALRVAFKKELESPKIFFVAATNTPFIPDPAIIPTTVYETNVSDIGLLSADEVDLIIEYYRLVQLVQTGYQRKGIKIPRSWVEENLGKEAVENLEYQFVDSEEVDSPVKNARSANESRVQAIEEIESRLESRLWDKIRAMVLRSGS